MEAHEVDEPRPERFASLPPRIPLTDTVASSAVKEHPEPLPDQQELDKSWAVRWYG